MRPIVLMYHDVYEVNSAESGFDTPGARHYKIDKTTFVEHVKAITQYCEANGLSKEGIIFTFDDGGVSFYTIIAPILEEYGWRGVFFISTKYIGTEGFMTSSQIADLHQRGHIIGSHSHHHRVLTEMSQKDVENELKQSKEILSKIIDESITTISIPNGGYSKRILDIAINVGLISIYTSKPTTKVRMVKGCESTRNVEATLIGRFAITYDTSVEDVMQIITQSALRNKMELKYNALQLVKGVFGSSYSKIKMWIRKYLVK